MWGTLWTNEAIDQRQEIREGGRLLYTSVRALFIKTIKPITECFSGLSLMNYLTQNSNAIVLLGIQQLMRASWIKDLFKANPLGYEPTNLKFLTTSSRQNERASNTSQGPQKSLFLIQKSLNTESVQYKTSSIHSIGT